MEIGTQSLYDIEVSLLTQTQKEFTEEAKKTKFFV
jgi:hypothetical protein